MAFIDTLKFVLGSAWHVNSDAVLAALLPATDGTVEASKVVTTDANKVVTGLAGVTPAAGTATQAPQTLVAGTNLTTAAAGATEYDGKVFYDTAVASSRQVRDTEQFCCLTTDFPSGSNALLDTAVASPLFNSSTNGAVTLAAATSYFFEELVLLSNTGTTSHTWSALFAGTASLTSIAYEFLSYTGTTSGVTATAVLGGQSAVATAVAVTAASTSATEFVSCRITGIVRILAGGTFIPQFKASARPGATGTPGVTVLAGSFFRCWPVGNGTVATVGNWS